MYMYIYIILDDLHLFHTLLPFPATPQDFEVRRRARFAEWLEAFRGGCRWSDARRPRHNCWWRRWALDRDFGWKTWWKTGESPRKMGTSRRIFWELDWGNYPNYPQKMGHWIDVNWIGVTLTRTGEVLVISSNYSWCWETGDWIAWCRKFAMLSGTGSICCSWLGLVMGIS